MIRKAIYAGSFDPITNGHLAVIKEGLKGFGKIVILVATNPDKIERYMFSAEERVAIVRSATAHLGDAVEVVQFDNGFIANYAKRHNITALIRGVRSLEDYEVEAKNADGNRQINPELATFLVFAPKEVELISSSFIKGNIFGPHGWVDEMRHFAPDATVRALACKMLHKKWNELLARLCPEAPDEGIHQEVIDELISAYASEDRHYHCVEHIIRGLDDIEEYERAKRNDLFGAELVEAKFAWIFHDYIQKSEKPEADSAEYAVKIAQQFDLEKEFAKRISSIILVTAHNKTPEKWSIKEDDVVACVDLAILGTKPEIYDRYVAQIREEYAQFSDLEFAKGRAEVIEKFLSRKRIYCVKEFHEKYEAQARKNLKRELQNYL